MPFKASFLVAACLLALASAAFAPPAVPVCPNNNGRLLLLGAPAATSSNFIPNVFVYRRRSASDGWSAAWSLHFHEYRAELLLHPEYYAVVHFQHLQRCSAHHSDWHWYHDWRRLHGGAEWWIYLLWRRSERDDQHPQQSVPTPPINPQSISVLAAFSFTTFRAGSSPPAPVCHPWSIPLRTRMPPMDSSLCGVLMAGMEWSSTQILVPRVSICAGLSTALLSCLSYPRPVPASIRQRFKQALHVPPLRLPRVLFSTALILLVSL